MKKLSVLLPIIMVLSACQSTELTKAEKDEKAKKAKSPLCQTVASTGSRLKKRGC